MQKYPKLYLRLNFVDSDTHLESLKTGSSQFSILQRGQVVQEMDSKLLKPEKYVMVATSKWKGRSIREVVKNETLIDFEPSDEMSFNYLKKFSLLSLVRGDRYFVNNNETLIRLFTHGIGYGVLTVEVAQPLLRAGKLILLNSGKHYENEVALAWYPRKVMPSYFRDLVKAIK